MQQASYFRICKYENAKNKAKVYFGTGKPRSLSLVKTRDMPST